MCPSSVTSPIKNIGSLGDLHRANKITINNIEQGLAVYFSRFGADFTRRIWVYRVQGFPQKLSGGGEVLQK